MPKVIIKPDDIVFEIENDQNILDNALKHNLNLPHGCKDGRCGACKCKVVSGNIKLGQYSSLVLTDKEIKQGYTLLCKTFANSDVELYIPEILNNFPIKILPAKVTSIEKNNNIAIIKMKTPRTQKFNFFAGQYVEIILHDKNRSYSIANACKDDGEVEFHVKYYKGGVFSEFVWNELCVGQILRFRGPLGNFKVHKSDSPVIFVCTGTGFAPIKSIMEEYAKGGNNREMYFYWGNREREDFYLLDQIYKWKESLGLKVKLCTSRDNGDDFVSGYVTDLIKDDFPDLSDFELYACGNIQMIEDVYELCTEKLKLQKERFYSDAFIPSA
ncbi:MAG: FAD-binding oxidoreductase [Neisseriaceae bacterium]